MAEGFLGWFKKQFSGKARPPSNFKSPPTPGAVSELPFADELTATEADVFNGELIFATSSNVHQWRYLGAELKLYVQFKSGGVYMYPNVPFAKAMQFFKTDSPGRFVHHFLKGTGEHKVGEMPPEPYHNVITTLDPWSAGDRKG